VTLACVNSRSCQSGRQATAQQLLRQQDQYLDALQQEIQALKKQSEEADDTARAEQ